ATRRVAFRAPAPGRARARAAAEAPHPAKETTRAPPPHGLAAPARLGRRPRAAAGRGASQERALVAVTRGWPLRAGGGRPRRVPAPPNGSGRRAGRTEGRGGRSAGRSRRGRRAALVRRRERSRDRPPAGASRVEWARGPPAAARGRAAGSRGRRRAGEPVPAGRGRRRAVQLRGVRNAVHGRRLHARRPARARRVRAGRTTPRAGTARRGPEGTVTRRGGRAARRGIRRDGLRPTSRRRGGAAHCAVCHPAGRRDRRALHPQPPSGGGGPRSPGGTHDPGSGDPRARVRLRLHARRARAAVLRAPGLRAGRTRRRARDQVEGLRRATPAAARGLPAGAAGPRIGCGTRFVSGWLRVLGTLVLVLGPAPAAVAGWHLTRDTAFADAAAAYARHPEHPLFEADYYRAAAWHYGLIAFVVGALLIGLTAGSALLGLGEALRRLPRR